MYQKARSLHADRRIRAGREDDVVVSYSRPAGPAAVSLASPRSEPATELTSSRSNTASGDAT
jgi:hypothetical protein